jgi:hypothetical protein
MHAINEAWRILGSQELRSKYAKERGRTKEESASVEETSSEDWFDLDAVDPPGFEVGNPLVATVLRVLPWLVVGAIVLLVTRPRRVRDGTVDDKAVDDGTVHDAGPQE